MTAARPRYVNQIRIGAILSGLGLGLILLWGDVRDVQAASSSAEFIAATLNHDNSLRLASWADILILVPGYTLLVLGVLTRIVSGDGVLSCVRRGTAVGRVVIVAAALADQIENVLVRLAIGNVDLTATDPTDVVEPGDSLISALHVTYLTKTALLGTTVVILLGLTVRSWWNRRNAADS
jgi:hypothetical protein